MPQRIRITKPIQRRGGGGDGKTPDDINTGKVVSAREAPLLIFAGNCGAASQADLESRGVEVVRDSSNGRDFLVGAGVQYNLDSSLSFRAQYETHKVGTVVTGRHSLNMLSAGMIIKF